jgi:hypothetical protein
MVLDCWNDLSEFVGATKALLSDTELWRRLSNNDQETVAERYTPEKQGDVVKQILKHLSL